MMNKLLGLLIVWLALGSIRQATAQQSTDKTCPLYQRYIDLGNTYLADEKYTEALNHFLAAQIHCPQRAKEAQGQIRKVFNAIEEQKKDLSEKIDLVNRQKDTIEIAQKKQQALLYDLEKKNDALKVASDSIKQERDRTQDALLKAEKLTNAFYFAYNKFALAYKNNKFYFIDKNGEPVEKLKWWYKAEQFNLSTGFAKVQDEQYTNHLIDTLGRNYRVAYNKFEINKPNKEERNAARRIRRRERSKVYSNYAISAAVDLSDKNIRKLPSSIWKHSHSLEILILDNNKFKNISKKTSKFSYLEFLILSNNRLFRLPENIYDMGSLEVLDISNNKFTTFPDKIKQLTNLKVLNLEGNTIEVEEIDRLQVLLPNCIIKYSGYDYYNLARLLEERLIHQIARKSNDVIKTLEKIYQAYQRATLVNPDTYYFWTGLAYTSLKIGKIEEAIQIAHKSINLSIQNDAHNCLVIGYAMQKEWEQAEISYSFCTKINKKHHDQGILNLIEALESLGTKNDSFKKLRKMISN